MKFALKLCIFLAPIACAMGYVEHDLLSVPNGYSEKRLIVEQRIPTTEILITGSSHSFEGIRPRALNQNALSLAYISQDLYYDTRLLLKYAPMAPNLKLVIIPISYFSLESRLETTIEPWRCAFYHRFFGFPVTDPFDIKNYSLIALYGPTETQSLVFTRFRTQSADLLADDGGPPDRFPERGNVDLSSEVTLARHNAAMRPSLIKQNVHYLNEALELLQSRSAAVVFITTPVYKSYYRHLNTGAYERMQDTIRSLTSQNGIPYHNYLEDTRFDESDFENCDHLNAWGRVKFTEILRNDLGLQKAR